MMRSYIIFMMILLVMSSSANELFLNTKKLENIAKKHKILQRENLQIKNGIETEELYFLKVRASSKIGSRVFDTFLDKKSGMLYFGRAYNKDGILLKFPKSKKIVEDAVAFSYGSGEKILYLFTDPECPYCHKFEKKYNGKLKEFTIKVIFFPLKAHQKAPLMIEWIMEAKTDEEKYKRQREIILEDSSEYLAKKNSARFAYSSEVKKLIFNSIKSAKELDVRGTPSVYDSNFKRLDWLKLSESLESNASKN